MTQSEGVARTDAAMIGLVWQVMLLLVERLVVGYTGHFGSMGTRMGEEGTCSKHHYNHALAHQCTHHLPTQLRLTARAIRLHSIHHAHVHPGTTLTCPHVSPFCLPKTHI